MASIGLKDLYSKHSVECGLDSVPYRQLRGRNDLVGLLHLEVGIILVDASVVQPGAVLRAFLDNLPVLHGPDDIVPKGSVVGAEVYAKGGGASAPVVGIDSLGIGRSEGSCDEV